MIVKPCEYCNEKPKKFNGLDRVDSNVGYTFLNVVPCCYDCNVMKSDLTLEKFKLHIKKIHDKFEGIK